MEKETTLDVVEAVEQIMIDFGDICRFCLAETSNNISIHDKCFAEGTTDNTDATIIDFVKKITSIQMDNLDGFPSLVCENCFNVIKICAEFSESCRQSDSSLRDCYEKTMEETKAKFTRIKLEEKECDKNVKSVLAEQNIELDDIIVKIETVSDSCKDFIDTEKQYSILKSEIEACPIEDNVNFNFPVQKRQNVCKRDSISILKAGTIKQKYQRINSLTERLKEAQSKLAEDILRTKDIMSGSVKIEDASDVDNKKMKFSCPQCFVSFVSSDMLTYHFLTSHTPERKKRRIANFKYQCKMCRKEFTHMHQLMRHYKIIHKIPLSKLSVECLAPKTKANAMTENKYECLDCEPAKVFNKRNYLFQHLTQHGIVEDRLKHVNERGKCYTCPKCDFDQTFTTKFSLNRHLMNIHKMDKNEITDKGYDSVSSNGGGTENPAGGGGGGGEEGGGSGLVGLKLMKMYLCLDCSPPASFSDVALFIDHKSELHEKKLESLNPKELTPVYVESVNVFDQGTEENNLTFKVICKSCDSPTEFYSASEFVQHMKVHHDDVPKEKWDVETIFFLNSLLAPKQRDRIWKCTECPASYIRKHSLHYHLKEKHNKVLRVGGAKCPDCDASFITNRQVVQHGIAVHKKYFANLHKVFKDKILDNSGQGDKRVRNFECDICQKKYLGKTSLKRHILKTHLGKPEPENAICPYCGKTFSNNLNLKSHIDFVHEALFVSCPICKKSINFKTIGKHYKIHQANTEFEPRAKNRFLCNQCGRVLKSKSGFDDHQKLHSNVRDQICDVCGRGFTTKKNLYIHKKAHDLTQKKLFQCDQCDKVFAGKHTLNRHLLTHSGQKNFICEICSKCFYTLQELNRHVRYHKKEYRFDCQLCDMRFLDRSRFRHHMMRHRNIRPHKCHFCDKVFIVRRKMNLHMAARHNVQVPNTKAIWKDPKTYIPLDDLL